METPYCVPGEQLTPTTQVKHGSTSGYALGCRGEHCRTAHREYTRTRTDHRKAYRARIKAELAEINAAKAAQEGGTM